MKGRTILSFGAGLTVLVAGLLIKSQSAISNLINNQAQSVTVTSRQLISEPCNLEQLPATTKCYRLSVPENRSKPSSRKISLAVVVLKSKSSQPKSDPVVFIPGGPGEPASLYLNSLVNSALLAQRDLILMDPRATGRSQPNLLCPKGVGDSNFLTTSRQPFSKSLALRLTSDRRCAEQLRSNGVDLDAYSTIEAANDLADLRAALGIREWNLYGISYGTRPALEMMRSHPQGVRSVVLDSVAVSSFSGKPTRFISSAQRGLDYLFAACQANSTCNQRFSNLGDRFTKMVNRYNTQPLRVQLPMNADRTLNTNIEVDGNALLTLVWGSLYREQLIPSLPLLIDQLATGKTALFNSVFFPLIQSSVSTNSSSSGPSAVPAITECIDSRRYVDKQDRAFLNNPGNYASLLLFQGLYCDAWGLTPAPVSFNQPVQSQIPTLLIAGSFDPATPPKDTRRTGERLSRSTYVEIPVGGHVPSITSNCAQSIMTAFITNPLKTPNASCVKSLKPQFTIL